MYDLLDIQKLEGDQANFDLWTSSLIHLRPEPMQWFYGCI